MTIKEIETRLLNIEKQMINLATRQTDRDDNSDGKLTEAKSKNAIIQGEMEETAITIADFLAEYYLSQLGIDDYDMEGGEEE